MLRLLAGLASALQYLTLRWCASSNMKAPTVVCCIATCALDTV